ncbi:MULTISPECIES: heme exporter protein CcmB [Gammaproteobacteria]|uniref:heme exporter protein CcmB n=1 Tax=Gammaproteobacteria TaxID=1236 RepID=UPI001E2ED390|nr:MULTISPECIES: heme exporter protein CcmB [Gammaproteobacteria]MDP5036931.1 heme exporter protein CcmB [Alishewanella sp.]MCC5450319.1 heme exporter protein CcmB [Rheinheimera sp. UJ51]MCF4009250.1 heme exporter protein CcmB [Rheinheimera sp. UJ63]MDP5186559.1 heme exporter protein CcmB [Alishewanella sp.]MDP5460108.1 heme exporter protein CcmB [Alishewanella sp. SMS8]
MVKFSIFLQRELRLLARQKADWLNPVLFFIIVLTLFPLGVGPEPNMLRIMAPGIVWIAALLSVLLAAERLFKDDYRNGVIEQLVAAQQALMPFVLAKITANWLSTGLPLLLLSPLVALLLNMQGAALEAMALTLLLGTPVLSLLSVLGAGITVSADKGGILLALVILPLYIPLLIFASAAIEAASIGLGFTGQIAILLAMFLFSLALVPMAVCSALKINVS